jgi:hypothetical protein
LHLDWFHGRRRPPVPRPDHLTSIVVNENDGVPRCLHFSLDRLTITLVKVDLKTDQNELVLDALTGSVSRLTHHQHVGSVLGEYRTNKEKDD